VLFKGKTPVVANVRDCDKLESIVQQD